MCYCNVPLDGFFRCLVGDLKDGQANEGEIVILLRIDGGDIVAAKVCVAKGCYNVTLTVGGDDGVACEVQGMQAYWQRVWYFDGMRS